MSGQEQPVDHSSRARITLSSIGDGVVSVDAGGRIEFMNEAASKLTGWTAAGNFAPEIIRPTFRVEGHAELPAPRPVVYERLMTGEVLSVEGTPFDFREAKPIGRDIAALGGVGGGGYDHNWCLSDAGDPMRLCAEVRDRASGRRMTLRTTEPGVQVYAGGYLDASVLGKGGVAYARFGGFTLETQRFPGSPNHPHFPSCVLRPGEVYEHRMELAFATDG